MKTYEINALEIRHPNGFTTEIADATSAAFESDEEAIAAFSALSKLIKRMGLGTLHGYLVKPGDDKEPEKTFDMDAFNFPDLYHNCFIHKGEEFCCPHDEHDHGICLYCGMDITQDLVAKAEYAFEGER